MSISFKVYFYSLKDDGEIYNAQFQSDDAAEAFILDMYGSNVSAIWRPARTIYEDVQEPQMSEVQRKRRRRSRKRAVR